MSQYGGPQQGWNQPQQYGNNPAYGQGQQYGGYPPQGYGQPAGGYANWGERALAMLWDVVVVLWPLALMFGGVLLAGVGGALSSGDSSGLGTALVLIGVLVVVAGLRRGRSGARSRTSSSTRAAPATPTASARWASG